MQTKPNTIFTFNKFVVDAERRLLLKQDEVVTLNSKAFDLLLVLIENYGRLLTKNELLETVWENQFVEENNLTVHISALRKSLGEKKDEHQFIVTVPGKGYKFVSEVKRSFNQERTAGLVKSLPRANSITNYSIVPTNAHNRLDSNGAFIGRKREIEETKHLLRRDDIYLVTLTGAGGTGKTSLARAVAAELKTDFSDGVVFVELAAANDTKFVVSSIAQTLGVTESAGKLLVEEIKEFLRERQILLILDNFEQILDSAPLVNEFLSGAASLKILVTSRAPLRLKNEYEFLVTPLDLPPPNTTFSLEKLAEYPAVLLFFKRAQAVKPLFLLADENISVVVKICQRLDGLPLAIELAAARIKLLSPPEILYRLEKSLNLLTGGANDSPVRQRTMRDTIRWSYNLLTAEEQILFRRLSVFAGGLSVEGAEAVASRHLTNILDLLTFLIDNNLLVSKEQTGGNVRLRMLEVVREFAVEMLAESGELEELQQIHAAYFLEIAEKADEFLLSETGNEWLQKLEGEHDNMRAALNWALKNDAETATRIAAALRFFWSNHSHHSEGLRLSRAALQASENTTSVARLKLLLSNGLFLKNYGNLEAAQNSYQQCLIESTKAKDLVHLIKANHGLAAVTVLQKDYSAAQKYNEAALELSREIRDVMQIAYSLCSLGDLELCKGNFISARRLLDECLPLAKKLGNNRLLTTTYLNLGTVDYLENEFEKADFNFAQSLRIAAEMGNPTMISCALDGFAAIFAINGNVEKSAQLSGAVENLRESVGSPLEPAEESFRANYLAKVRDDLNESIFSTLYAQGKTMSSDEAIALVNSQSLVKKTTTSEFYYPDEPITEIIIEQHKFERITIEDEIQINKDSPLLLFAKQKLSKPWFVLLLVILLSTVIGFGYWFWKNTGNSESQPLKSTSNMREFSNRNRM